MEVVLAPRVDRAVAMAVVLDPQVDRVAAMVVVTVVVLDPLGEKIVAALRMTAGQVALAAVQGPQVVETATRVVRPGRMTVKVAARAVRQTPNQTAMMDLDRRDNRVSVTTQVAMPATVALRQSRAAAVVIPPVLIQQVIKVAVRVRVRTLWKADIPIKEAQRVATRRLPRVPKRGMVPVALR